MELTIFEKFVILRKRVGITQQEAADLIGCSRRTVQEWEKGKGSEWVCNLALEYLLHKAQQCHVL